MHRAPTTAGATAATRLALLGSFAALWLLATDAEPASWWIGLPTIAAASAVAIRLGARLPRLRIAALPSFVAYLLVRSLRGSIEVALTALRPRLAMDPVVFAYRLERDRGAVFLAMLVSLLPGTLAARLEEGGLVVHSLSAEDPARREIRALEERLARLLPEPRPSTSHA